MAHSEKKLKKLRNFEEKQNLTFQFKKKNNWIPKNFQMWKNIVRYFNFQ